MLDVVKYGFLVSIFNSTIRKVDSIDITLRHFSSKTINKKLGEEEVLSDC